MQAVIDSGGRIILPKQLRDALGLAPGTKVDISVYRGGLHVIPGGRTARLERDEDGRLVARADTVVTDEMMFALIQDDVDVGACRRAVDRDGQLRGSGGSQAFTRVLGEALGT